MSEPHDGFLEVNGLQIRYVDWGNNGPSVLLLHGDMRTSRSWDAVARDLKDKFRVVSMDARGHGDSDWPETGYTYSPRIDEVAGLCEQLGISDAIGVGHSSGGAVIALVAERYPKLFGSLALLEPVVEMNEAFQRRVAQRYEWTRSTWDSFDQLRDTLKNHAVAGKWRDDVIEDVVRYEAMELPNGKIDMKWSIDTMKWSEREGEYFELMPIFRGFDGPILFVTSSERENGFEIVKPLIEELPDFQMVTLDNSGHNMYMERPDAVASTISAFVDGKQLPTNL